MRSVKDTVAVVVPRSDRVELLPDEEVSLRHLCHYLRRYDKYFVLPAGSPVRHDEINNVYFPRKFFGSLSAHTHLIFSPEYYATFERYEYVLIYHLDSLVFSDELLRWCRTGWDYIGAPWLPCSDTPWVKEAQVGNGGFTLMKVQSAVRALRNRYRERPVMYVADVLLRNPQWTRPIFQTLENLQGAVRGPEFVQRMIGKWQRSQDPATYGCNNDYFWSVEAAQYLPSYRVAPVEQALRFAFEAAPRMCFEMNHRQLPFGCHAWSKFDRAFWEPYLLPPTFHSSVAEQGRRRTAI